MTTVADKLGAGGPMVGVCAGGRCTALRRLRDAHAAGVDAFDTAQVRAIRCAVRETRGGILVRLGCLGPCQHGAVVGVGYQPAGADTTRDTAWFGGADTPVVHRALLAWIGSDWSTATPPAPAEFARRLVRPARPSDPRR